MDILLGVTPPAVSVAPTFVPFHGIHSVLVLLTPGLTGRFFIEPVPSFGLDK
jgi:hypothetical protein